MTATAFMSVSLEPPLVMVSVRDGSRMDELLERQPLWAVSLLTESQRQTAGRFAMKGRLSDRLLFQELPHTRGEASGAPLVDGRAGDASSAVRSSGYGRATTRWSSGGC